MSQDFSLTQSGHSVRQALTAYSDQNFFPDSRIWCPERQQVEQPAVVDLEKWRRQLLFFRRRDQLRQLGDVGCDPPRLVALNPSTR